MGDFTTANSWATVPLAFVRRESPEFHKQKPEFHRRKIRHTRLNGSQDQYTRILKPEVVRETTSEYYFLFVYVAGNLECHLCHDLAPTWLSKSIIESDV